MSELKIFCQNCRQKLAVPPELIGSEIECPSCNHTVKVTKQIDDCGFYFGNYPQLKPKQISIIKKKHFIYKKLEIKFHHISNRIKFKIL